MSVEENKAIMRRLYEIVKSGKFDEADEIIAVDMVDHDPVPGASQGLAGFKETARILHSAFPDMQITIDQLIAEDDVVAARFTMRGVHRGELMGMAPTGKEVTVTGMDIIRFKDGKGVEHWANQDDLGMMRQFGLLPAPAQQERERGR
jgi:predicted ester cyclase